MNWYLDPLTKKYAEFEGRARRQEFWMFFLISFLISLALGVGDLVLKLPTLPSGGGPLGTLYMLAVLVPTLAIGARRLHDTGKSGWLQLLLLIPCIGFLVLVFFWIGDSQPGGNQYGPNPKGATSRDDDYDDRR